MLLVSTVVVYVYLDNFSQPETTVVEDEPLEEDVLDPIAEKVIGMMYQLDESMMQGYMEKLTSFGPHVTAHRIPYKLSNRPIIGRFFDLPIEKVARYLYNEFESMGLKVRYQHWEQDPTIKNLKVPDWFFGWFVGDNVVATLPGTDPSSDEQIVLVAHYDTMPKTVGANDDSSGVALLLAAAKLMKQYSFNHTIVFLAVSGEEQWLMGSHAYVEEAVKNNDNIVATFCIDMIGTHGPDYRDTEVLIATLNESYWIVNFINNVNKRYPEFLDYIVFSDEVTLDNFKGHGSDYQEFLKQGYDAVYIAEATFDEDWHKPSDTIENTDITYVTEVSRLILATVAEMAWDFEYE